MNKLEELIQELCPNGVKYRTVGDICNICRGVVISKDFIRDNVGAYPVYSSQTENNGELGKINTYSFDGEYLTWTTDGANAGSVFYRNGKFSVTNVCGVLEMKDNNISAKFLFYVLQTSVKPYVNKGMGNPKLMSNVMARVKVPVPPIEVQEEIVRILDKFTELTAELTAELTEELTARKKQYEFYRDNILNFSNDVPRYKLAEIFNTRNGYTPSKNNKQFWNTSEISWFRMEDIRENGRILDKAIQGVSISAVKGKAFPKNSIIISTSATIGEHALIKCESLANQRFTYLILKDEYKDKYNIMFLFYYCFVLDEYCKENLNQGNFASVDMRKFNEFEFPMPSLEEQDHIVAILDRFDKLCNDISEGLPAEIDARQKQYEYYRDKLLTFEEIAQ